MMIKEISLDKMCNWQVKKFKANFKNKKLLAMMMILSARECNYFKIKK